MDTSIDILLVEDNMDEAILAMRVLKKHRNDINILHLKDGAEAIDFLYGTGPYIGRDLSQKPKLILLDINMPKQSGIEVLENIKANERTKQIPAVVMISSAQGSDIEKCNALGVDGHIFKPVSVENYLKIVQDLGIK